MCSRILKWTIFARGATDSQDAKSSTGRSQRKHEGNPIGQHPRGTADGIGIVQASIKTEAQPFAFDTSELQSLRIEEQRRRRVSRCWLEMREDQIGGDGLVMIVNHMTIRFATRPRLQWFGRVPLFFSAAAQSILPMADETFDDGDPALFADLSFTIIPDPTTTAQLLRKVRAWSRTSRTDDPSWPTTSPRTAASWCPLMLMTATSILNPRSRTSSRPLPTSPTTQSRRIGTSMS